MDSVFNDIEFIMQSNIKQETPNTTNERAAEPSAEGVQNNDTDQLAMSTYMTDFILDYINRTLKNEDEDTQQENTTSDQENQEESVDDLLERAENMIRENAQHCNQVSIPEASVANNEWIQQSNAPQGSFTENNANSSGQITDPVAEAVRLLAGNEVSDVISVDTDSDDEVIFVNSHKPATEIIDLSDHSSPNDNSMQSSQKRESRKRNHDSIEIVCDSPAVPVPVERPQEKQFRHNCAICLDDVKSPHSTTCGHIYCRDCIKNALKIFKKCPTCNKKLKVSNVHPIYL